MDREFILDGMANGFHITKPDAQLKPSCLPNHKSAMSNKEATWKLIEKEVVLGNYIQVDSAPTIVSPLALVPKGEGFRLIHDCSAPCHSCLNSYAPEFDKYSYETVDHAVSMLTPGDYMAKVDIRAAYRHVSIHPSSQRATGLAWQVNGKTVYYVDTKLPFGAKASPTIFHRLSQSVKRMMIRKGHEHIVAYQDDFLVMGSTYQECYDIWMALQTLLEDLGFKLSIEKLIKPTTCITFLGIEIDSKNMCVRLPLDKLDNIRTIVGQFLGMKRATKRQLQQLAGKLNFASRAVRGGRIFLRRILDSITKLKHQHHKTRVRGALRDDILWWDRFLLQFNGISTWINDNEVATIVTDACLESGGCFYNGDFLYTVWQADHPSAVDLPINYKETLMASLAVIHWAPYLGSKVVNVFTDNTCAAAIMNKCTCRSPLIMSVIRDMFWMAATYNFVVKASYWPGERNIIADTVSRLHQPGKFSLFESLYNGWHGHGGLTSKIIAPFDSISMANHMSLKSLLFVLPQVLEWRCRRNTWMGWPSSLRQPPWLMQQSLRMLQ